VSKVLKGHPDLMENLGQKETKDVLEQTGVQDLQADQVQMDQMV